MKDGVSGYIYHTVPAVLHIWLTHQDAYRNAILKIIHLGGDTDTTAAILGGIIGAHVGKEGIPQEWLDNLQAWPVTISWMERLSVQLANSVITNQSSKPPSLFHPFVLMRNLFFLIIVLLHGFRRLLHR